MQQWHDAMRLEWGLRRTGKDKRAHRACPEPTSDETGPIKISRIGQRRRRRLQSLLDCAALLPVEQLSRPGVTTKTQHTLELRVESRPVAVIRIKELGRRPIDVVFDKFPSSRPQTAQTICNILQETGINIDAVALLRRGRSAIHAALVVADDKQQAIVPINGIDALAIGCAAGCPIVLTETLAEKLTPRRR